MQCVSGSYMYSDICSSEELSRSRGVEFVRGISMQNDVGSLEYKMLPNKSVTGICSGW